MTGEEAGAALADHRSADAEEVDRFAYGPRSTACARITELRAQGRIIDSGKRRKQRSGASATVWIVPTR